MTRTGRRRRVLNEEVLTSHLTVRSASTERELEPGDTPRYGAGANIENHPQVTSFVPRKLRTLGLIALAGGGVSVVAELAATYAPQLSTLLPAVSAEEITTVFAHRLVAWTAATLLLLTAGYSWLIYSLRRHRIDDHRGRYQVWGLAGWAALGLSLNAVLGAHELIARGLGQLVGRQMLPAHAGWWLVPATLLGGWLMTKLILDASECRSAMATYLLAIGCFTAAGAHSAGWTPTWAASAPGLLSRTLPLQGYVFALVGSMMFARYVILDVQGLIEHPATDTPARAEPAAEPSGQASTTPAEVSAEVPELVSGEVFEAELAESLTAADSAWVDGSQPEEDYDQDDTGRLSKAERKRLRKQQRNRAA